MQSDYNDFWQKHIGVKGKRFGWFRRKRYAVLAKLFPRFMLKRFPARKYHLGVASISEGDFCDIGSGLGGATALYNALSNKPAVGIDISVEAVSFAQSEKKRLGFKKVRFAVSDVFRTPFKDNSFDTVYLGQILEHLPDEHKSLREACRILKPNGLLVITVPKEDMLPSPYHVREYTTDSLKNLLKPYSNEEIAFYDFDKTRLAASLRIKK
ncbi:MAG: class I SAM-dependent methyltransferase [Planctomycetes bacterium]|nr:class I SAM-dependent methyltransferase [Planctomycetota bacterium]